MTCLNRHYSKPRVEISLSSVTNTLSFAHHLPQLMLYPLGLSQVVVKTQLRNWIAKGRLPLTWYKYQSKVLASYVRYPRSRDEVCSDWCIRWINNTINMRLYLSDNTPSKTSYILTSIRKSFPLSLSRTVWVLISTNSGSLLQLAAIAQNRLVSMCLVFPMKCAPPTNAVRLQ